MSGTEARIIGREAMTSYLELLDWRRRVSELYLELRRREPDADTAAWFRAERGRLLGGHPQSPLPRGRRDPAQLPGYWPWDPTGRVTARFEPVGDGSDPEPMRSGEAALQIVGTLRFKLWHQPCSLLALWVEGYAGGLFVPFRDLTNGMETYGGGRYLVDSIKSADLGSDFTTGHVILDFNYAYHPSCAYDAMWPCPLAPPQNQLNLAVRLGEWLPRPDRGQ